MSIIRVKKDKNYFVARNETFNDSNLSWEARGVLAYLFSKRDDWEIRFADLVNKGDAKRFKMRRILKELDEAGYLYRKRIKADEGKFTWITVVFENPSDKEEYVETMGQSLTHGDTIGRSPTGGASTDGGLTDIESTESTNTNNEEIEDINPNGKYSEYEVAFCNKAHLPPLTPSPRKWNEACEKLHAAGVEPQDIERAVDILRDRDYSIIGLSSVVNTAINEMGKRKGKQTEVDRSKYVKGEYADFIEH